MKLSKSPKVLWRNCYNIRYLFEFAIEKSKIILLSENRDIARILKADYYLRLLAIYSHLRTFLDESERRTKYRTGSRHSSSETYPNSWPSTKCHIFRPSPGTQWIVERLIVYCMIIDILPEILLINIYINFIATVEHNNIWGYMIRAIPSVFIGDIENTRSKEKKRKSE